MRNQEGGGGGIGFVAIGCLGIAASSIVADLFKGDRRMSASLAIGTVRSERTQ